MSKTRVQLVNEALANLNEVGSGQSPEAEDQQYVDVKVDGLFAQLATDLIVSVDDEDAIPDEWFNPLAQLLANECATKFSQQYDPGKKAVFEAQLRRLAASRPTYEIQKAQYF